MLYCMSSVAKSNMYLSAFAQLHSHVLVGSRTGMPVS